MRSIFIVDDMVYRYGLISIMEGYSEFKIVGEGDVVEETIEDIDRKKPDIIIIEIYGNNQCRIDLLDTIKKCSPESKILVLTQSVKEEDCLNSIKAGARGYLQKGINVNELIECIKIVANGDAMVFTSAAAKSLETTWSPNDRTRKVSSELSGREKEILSLVSHGINTKEIAERCFVSETTIKAHVKSVMEKLDAKNRAQAVAKAIEKGILS